jgi:steroid delta-isomerase-like uncharacterized protein
MAATEIIQKYYQHFNNKNWQGMLDLLDENVVHDISQGASQKGVAAFREFLAIMDKYYDENLTEMVFLADSTGKRLAAEFICNGVYKVSAEGLPKANGQKYKILVGAFFELNGNKIKRISNHYNINDWVKQVGG